MKHIDTEEFVCLPSEIKLRRRLALLPTDCLAVRIRPMEYLVPCSSQYDSLDQFKVLTGKTLIIQHSENGYFLKLALLCLMAL